MLDASPHQATFRPISHPYTVMQAHFGEISDRNPRW